MNDNRIGQLQNGQLPLPFDLNMVNTALNDIGLNFTNGLNNLLKDNVNLANSFLAGAPKVFTFLPQAPQLPTPQNIQSMNLPQMPDIQSAFSNLPFPFPQPTTTPGTTGGAPPMGGSLGEDYWREELQFRE